MDQESDYFPVLGIQDFNEDRDSEKYILFNELHGERSIDHPHKHDFFIINIFEKGNGVHVIDFVSHQISQHQVHLVFPDQVHHWNIEKGTVGYQLMISRSWFENLIPFLRFPTVFYQANSVFELSKESFASLLHEFDLIRKELDEDPVFWKIVEKRCELIGLMISKSVETIFRDSSVFHSNPVVAKFYSLIDEYFKSERSVSFYAEKLNISANYLNIICKKSLTVSASSLIQNRILLEAKRLLKVSDMSVKDIVFNLGFYDHASFSKFFKSHTGMTPTKFKE